MSFDSRIRLIINKEVILPLLLMHSAFDKYLLFYILELKQAKQIQNQLLTQRVKIKLTKSIIPPIHFYLLFFFCDIID